MLSSRLPSGDATQAPTFWSKVEVSQSAARAAGVVPPITKWKKRGPAERVAAASPSRASSLTAATAPSPSSGSVTIEGDGGVLAARGLHRVVVQSTEKGARLRRDDLQDRIQLATPLTWVRHGPGCYG